MAETAPTPLMPSRKPVSNKDDGEPVLIVKNFKVPHFIIMAMLGLLGVGGWRYGTTQKDDLAGRVEGARIALTNELQPLEAKVGDLDKQVQQLNTDVKVLETELRDQRRQAEPATFTETR